MSASSPRRLPNRWVVAAAAVVMQVCLGTVYSWSVYIKPLAAREPWSLVQISATFPMAMAFLGIGAVLGGLWQDKRGPRFVSSAAGVLYGLGFMVAAFAVSQHSLYGLWAGYGFMSGLGIGMGYICPVATITKWFPDKRGLMTGAAVMGFGAGAVAASPIAARLIITAGVPTTFLVFGILYLVLVVASAQFLVDPPHGWLPEGWNPAAHAAKTGNDRDYSVREALGTWRFWLLWLMLSLNTSAGIMIVSQASPLAQQQVGLTVVEASAVVAAISIFNATGRIFWAYMSDLAGRAEIYFVLFAIQVFLFFTLPRVHDAVWFEIVVCAIALCYGGGFGVMPSFVADFFGSKNIGGIYGWILLGWGAAAVPSPLLIAHVRQTTGTYSFAIFCIGFVMLIAMIFPLLAKRVVTRLAFQQGQRVMATD